MQQNNIPGSAAVPPNAAYFLRPQGAFGVRQLAAAFMNIGLFSKAPCGRENHAVLTDYVQ
jgi:hypothetical protein